MRLCAGDPRVQPIPFACRTIIFYNRKERKGLERFETFASAASFAVENMAFPDVDGPLTLQRY